MKKGLERVSKDYPVYEIDLDPLPEMGKTQAPRISRTRGGTSRPCRSLRA